MIKTFNTGEGPKKSTCPYCNSQLDRSEGFSTYNPDDRLPQPGDVSVCAECGEPAIFDEDMVMVKPTDEVRAELMENEDVRLTSFMVKAKKSSDDPELQRRYSNHLESMATSVREWRAKNPNTNPMIQYNYGGKIGLIATFREAVEKKFVMLNDDAKAMLEELGWMNVNPTMPTVNMVKAVLDHVFGKEE